MLSPAGNLHLIDRLRSLRINIQDENSAPFEGDKGTESAINDLNEIFNQSNLSFDDTIDNYDHDDSDEEEDCAELFAICETVDDSLLGLYTIDKDGVRLDRVDTGSTKIEYDWILDGDLEVGGSTSKSRRRKQFGEPSLDEPLEMMELEDPSLVTASISPDHVLDETLESKYGDIDFADFKDFDCEVSDFNTDGNANEDEWGDFASTNNHIDEREINECHEEDIFIGSMVDTSNECRSPIEYQPPDEISQLVSHINAELDVTIDDFLNTSIDCQTEDASHYNTDSLDSKSALDMSIDNDHYTERYHGKTNYLEAPKSPQNYSKYQQPLLMSSMLMESLPLTIPNMASDHLASFTYRVQKAHRDTMGLGSSETDEHARSMIHDTILEKKLVDTVHSGYFEGTGGDDDNFDSIVLDEVLNVPWPFYILDLNEPIVEDEYNELDPDEIDSNNDLNFDSYIFNRLGQLDIAKGEVTKSIISRVSWKEKNVVVGTKCIIDAELDVATALMYANASRENVQQMLKGYPIDDQSTKKPELHKAIHGSLDIIEIADTRTKILYLADTVERITGICEKEVLFWKEMPNLKSPHLLPIPSEKYKELIERARHLYNLTLEEEVLNHIVSLQSLRDRIHGLSGVLLECLEDSIANLIHRMLNANDICNSEYREEYDVLVSAWISCCQLKQGTDIHHINIIANGWSGCLLKVLCFEISKAFVFSLIDTLESNVASDCIKDELDSLRCSTAVDADIDKLMNRLINGQHIVASAFPHLAMRSTELMLIYCLLIRWHSNKVETSKETNTESQDNLEINSDSENISSMSTDDLSSNSIHDDDTDIDKSTECQIQSVAFKNKPNQVDYMVHKCMLNSMNRSIRHPLLTFCESKLTQTIEYSLSCTSAKVLLEDLSEIEDIFQQFTRFALCFLGDDHDEELAVCQNIKTGLHELYLAHLRSVHIEAMKTTGTLLMHESWQLSSLDFTRSENDDEKKSDNDESIVDDQRALMTSLQHAVVDHIYEFLNRTPPSNKRTKITDRAIYHGYGQLDFFASFFDAELPATRNVQSNDLRARMPDCDDIKEFTLFLHQFIEKKSQYSLSIMTQSSVNGLLKWSARLLSIGITLPMLVDDVTAAMTTLFDLYILTVFRICGHNARNEDALIGIVDKKVSSSSTNLLSLTIESDICSPFYGEDLTPLQNYVAGARERLCGIVNLDKFEAGSCDISSPRSENYMNHVVTRLEKEVAAISSCLFASLLAHASSQLLSRGIMSSDDVTTVDSDSPFERYARNVVTMTPQLIRQSCRLACTHAISGKDVIFQIICLGNIWEDDDIHEYSNAYVDDLHERCSELWARLSSSSAPSLPYNLLKYTWDMITRSAFYTLVEGFSKVTKCSTGGRSLMSMDVNTLSDGLNSLSVEKHISEIYPTVNPPPISSNHEENKQYVDAYIKVFFYPDEVLHEWITENHKKYREEHMMSLIAAKRALGNGKDGFWEPIEEFVRALYQN